MRDLAGPRGRCLAVAVTLLTAAGFAAFSANASTTDPQVLQSPGNLPQFDPIPYIAVYDRPEAPRPGGLSGPEFWSAPDDVSRPSAGVKESALDFPWKITPPGSARQLSLTRAVIWGGVSLTGALAAFDQSQSVWGESRGKVHFKEDFKGTGWR